MVRHIPCSRSTTLHTPWEHTVGTDPNKPPHGLGATASKLPKHCAQCCRCFSTHIRLATWHLGCCRLNAFAEVLSRLCPHRSVLRGWRQRCLAEQTAAHLFDHRAHRHFVLVVHPLQFRLCELLPIDVAGSSIGDVLDNPVAVGHEHVGCLHAR